MKFKQKGGQGSQVPEVNLVPMMDVILTVLTFFILATMTMTNFKAIDAALPSSEKGANKETPQEPLIVGMTRQGQVVIANAPVNETQMAQQVVAYFQKNPKGSIVLKADKNLAYEKVVQTLGTLRDVGGDKVSLAIE